MQIRVISLLIALLPRREIAEGIASDFMKLHIMRIIRLRRLMHFDHLHVIEPLAMRIPITQCLFHWMLARMLHQCLVTPNLWLGISVY